MESSSGGNSFPLRWIEYFPVGPRRGIKTAGAETHCVCLAFDTECWWHVECKRHCWWSQDAAAMGNTCRGSEVTINEERQPGVKLALADLSVKPTQSYSAENVTAVELFKYRHCCFIKIHNPTIAGWTCAVLSGLQAIPKAHSNEPFN